MAFNQSQFIFYVSKFVFIQENMPEFIPYTVAVIFVQGKVRISTVSFLEPISVSRLFRYKIYHYKLEQLECLHFEIPPAPTPWLPILVIHIRSQVKTRQSQSYKLKKLSKILILKFCKELYTRHTICSGLIGCINMKWNPWELQALQSGHGMREGRTDGLTDGRTEWNQYTPHNFVVQGV